MDHATQTHTPAQAPAPAPNPKQPSGWGRLFGALGFGMLAGIIMVGVQVAGIVVGYTAPVDMNALTTASELVGGMAALFFTIALGGKGLARPSMAGMSEAWRAAAWLFIVDGALVALETVELALGYETIDIAADWPVRIAGLALLCLGVGLFEESMMRGLCLNGLLARMGRTRGGVYGAVVLSSLMFGMFHMDVTVGFGEPLLVAQNVMKVLQTGMCGFLFAAILVKTRNLWTVIAIHAANDFMLLFITNGLTDAPVTTDYVQTGDAGTTILALYCTMCVLYLPFLRIGKRLIDQASPWRGDFYHCDSAPVPPGPSPHGTPPIAQPVAMPGTAYANPLPSIPVAQTVVADAPAIQPPLEPRKERSMHTRFSLEGTRGLIFDCDGTLLDSMPAWNELEAGFARQANVVLNEEQLEELRAAPIDECAAIFHNRYGLGNSPEHVLEMMDAALMGYYRDRASALPGVVTLLERARALGIPCVVLTSSPERYVQAGLAHAGIAGYFTRLITTDAVGMSKQDPGIWRLALDVLGSTPETTWGFEDSVYAVNVMSSVGIRTVGAWDCDETGTYEQLEAAADIAVRSLEELL